MNKPSKFLKLTDLKDGAAASGDAIKAQTAETAFRHDLVRDALARYSVVDRSVQVQFHGRKGAPVKKDRGSIKKQSEQ